MKTVDDREGAYACSGVAHESSAERLAGERGVERPPGEAPASPAPRFLNATNETATREKTAGASGVTDPRGAIMRERDTGSTTGQAGVSGPLFPSCPPNTRDQLRRAHDLTTVHDDLVAGEDATTRVQPPFVSS